MDKIIPKTQLKAEEEEEEEEEEGAEDVAPAIKEECGNGPCHDAKMKLTDCNNRVNSKSNTTETCFEEVIDFYHCVDACATPKIFTHMK